MTVAGWSSSQCAEGVDRIEPRSALLPSLNDVKNLARLFLGLGGALTLGGCATSTHSPAVEPRLPAAARSAAHTEEKGPRGSGEPEIEVLLPDGIFEGLRQGESRVANVAVVNHGEAPFVVLLLELSGLGRGQRRLAVIEESEPMLRAFGFVAPGQTGRFDVGAWFPEAGESDIVLRVHLRALDPQAPGETMRETTIPALGSDSTRTFRYPGLVRAHPFTREAAEARLGIRAEDAIFIESLGCWFLRRGNATYLVSVAETVAFPGMSLEAAAFLEETQDDMVPILDEQGRLQEVPPGPVLRSILEKARMTGWSVTVEEEHGRRVVRVGP